MNRPPDMPDDGIDAHLRSALRHAPDQHQHAPALISARILAAARQATQPASAPLGWLRRWVAAPWAGAGSLAAVLLVSGVLWVQRDALPPAVAPTEIAAETEASTGATPATKAAEVPVTTSAGRQPVVPAAIRPARPSDAPQDAPAEARTTARTGATAQAIADVRADVGAQARVPSAPVEALPPAPPAAAVAGPMAPVPPAPPAPPAPSPRSPPSPPPAPPAPEAHASPAPAAEPQPLRQRSWQPSLPDEAAARPAQRLQERRALAATARAAPPLGHRLAPSASVAADTVTAWSVTTPDAVPRPLPAGWLQALADATPVWAEAPPAGTAPADARALSLWRDGETVVWLQLGRDRVQWCSAASGCWLATITAETSTALSAALGP